MINIAKELEVFKKGPEKIDINSFRTTRKKSNWKTPSHDGIHGIWFKKFTSIHDRLELEIKRCQQEADVSDWMTKGMNTWIKKNPIQRNSSKQLQTHNVST